MSKQLAALLVISLFGTDVSANTGIGSVSTGSAQTKFSVPDEGYRVYAGLGGGYGSLIGNRYESAPSGEHFIAGLSLSRRTRRWEWDTGLGWSYSRRSGLDERNGPMMIRIRSGRADFSARYRVWGGWQAGPIVTASFGTDTRNIPSIGSSIATIYGGGKATLDLPTFGPLALQAWGEILTELSSPGRDPFTALVGIRLGVPVSFERKTDVISISNAAPEREVRITLDAKKIFFGTSSAKLNPEAISTLKNAARFLARSPAGWESVEVSGHADERGPLPYNIELSNRRATNVREALLSQGVDEKRIQTEAFGPHKPADSARGRRAWARNRRVELVFKNVNDPATLRQQLQSLSDEPEIK